MSYDEFIRAVEQRTGVESREAADEVAVAVVQALADRLTGGEADDLVAQLPKPFKERIRISDEAQRWSADDFVEQVARELSVSPDRARELVNAVFVTLAEAVTPGEFDDVLAQLPADYADLMLPEAARR